MVFYNFINRFFLRAGVLAVFTCCVFASCNKQVVEPGSREVISSGTDGDLRRIMFINDSTGYIAGGIRYFRSDLLTTRDGGRTWSLRHFDTDDDHILYGLCHFQERVYAAAFNGKIFRLAHTEAEWQYNQAPWWGPFQSIGFATANKGFIVSGQGFESGRIIQIDSSGQVSRMDTFDFSLNDVCFADSESGYICGYGIILKTADGGSSWNIQDIQGDFFKALSCPDDHNVWAVGYNGTIVHSSNGGNVWEKQRNGDNPLLQRWRLNGVFFQDERRGYAVGDKGLIITTDDGGNSWKEIKNESGKDLYGVTAQQDGTLWVTGESGIIIKIRN
jgi:photosystem II stability/assembly factor-like uncharacterized protein